MPIVKPEDMNFSNKKIRMIVAGPPGIGKSTLSLSAPKPLLIDIDNGIDRVEAPFRKDTLVVSSYDALIKDLNESDLSPYETIVIDTGGKLLDLMKPKVISENAKNGQSDGSLALKGWGAVARKFNVFTDLVVAMGKHIIIIFHTKEEKDGDVTKLRIALEGSSKNKVWQDMDLGGFVQMQGKNRTISFSNCEKFYAKGTHGITGTYTIPALTEGVENDFLSTLFDTVLVDLQKTSDKFNTEKKVYDDAMTLKVFIDSALTLEQFNSVMKNIVDAVHALTSERELKNHLVAKATEKGFTYDANSKAFV